MLLQNSLHWFFEMSRIYRWLICFVPKVRENLPDLPWIFACKIILHLQYKLQLLQFSWFYRNITALRFSKNPWPLLQEQPTSSVKPGMFEVPKFTSQRVHPKRRWCHRETDRQEYGKAYSHKEWSRAGVWGPNWNAMLSWLMLDLLGGELWGIDS